MKKILMALMAAASVSLCAMADTAASFPGGEKAQAEFITKTLVYPPTAIDNGVEGVVTVVFTVKPDGTIGNIKIKRMLDPDLEGEAIRVVKAMPKWTPATKGEVAVESIAEIPFEFKLPE